ncbi:MAG: cyanophycinase [Psychrosphaera sp.]|nr:cyanophycinase [Psychrosphaera sp.]
MCPAKIIEGGSRGYVIPIGGAEERVDNPVILKRFVDLCGGNEARIAIIPTASRLEDTGANYVKVFKDLGVGEAYSLEIGERADAQDEANLDALDNATGIFMTGGNQLRLSTILGGTPFAQKIRRLNAGGVHVAGTSAGAAIMPEHMIAGGSSGGLPNEQVVTMAPGLGLINKVILDQHFSQRNRLGRLLSAIAYNPFASAIGICEDTAVFIGPDGILEVEGSGSVTFVDPTYLLFSSMADAYAGDAVTMLGLKLHMLSAGSTYDLATREAFPPAKD